MRIGICDDNTIHLEYINKYVRKLLSNHNDIIVESLSPEELATKIKQQSCSYDILITDIDLGNYNGIAFVKEVNQINPSCIIIFISSYLNYATEVYDVQHIYFVLKSELETRLKKALEKAILVCQNRREQYITFRYQNIDYRIPKENITYIEAMGRYLYIHDIKQTYTTISSLKSMQEQLPHNFVQCHKSYIVNLDYIRMINRTSCILTNGSDIPISRTYAKSFRNTYVSQVSSKLN